MKRRELLSAPAVLAAGAAAPNSAAAQTEVHRGWGLYPTKGSNPLECKLTVITIVSPDLAASKTFYTDVMGFEVLEEGAVSAVSTAPGAGQAGRKYLLIGQPRAIRGATIRVLEAPPGAAPIRPRGTGGNKAETWDPGLLVMEGAASDPCESYHVLKSAKTPMISPPRYYFFRGEGTQPDLDVMSYAPFGPGGEQLFLTANVRNDRPVWQNPGIHSPPSSVSLVALDQRPVEDFYVKVFGLKRTAQMDAHQRNCNELIGAPPDAYFIWGRMGDVSMEIWEFKMEQGTMYPCSLDKTGLAMITMRVKDLEKCRANCKAAGITPVGEGVLPLPGGGPAKGFTLRGAVGELVEVVQA